MYLYIYSHICIYIYTSFIYILVGASARRRRCPKDDQSSRSFRRGGGRLHVMLEEVSPTPPGNLDEAFVDELAEVHQREKRKSAEEVVS